MLQATASLIKEERGSAGILSIITMLLLGVVGAAYISLSSSEVNSSASYRNGVAAQFLAEAGARRAIVELDKDNNWTGTANWQTMGSGVTEGKYTVTVTSSGDDRIVISKGVVGNATRIMKLTVNLSRSTFPYPVFSDNHLSLNSSLVVEGGKIATSKKNQITYNGYTGPVLTEVNNVTMPSIPVAFNKNDYQDGNKTTLSTNPNTGNYDLSGLYYIDSSFNTNGGVNLKTTGNNSAIIYVEGNVTINGDITGNITFIAKQDITTNSGTTIDGTIKLYAGSNITLNRAMTGNITIMSKNDLTINSGASQLNKAAIYSKHDIMFNSGVHLTGVVVADNKLTFNGGKVTYSPLGFESSSTGSLTIKAWAPK